MKQLAILIILFALTADIAEAERRLYSEHKIKIAYYPVFGSNTEELRQNMLKNGPLSVDGRRYYAVTLWRIRILGRKHSNEIFKSSDLDCYVSMHLPKFMGHGDTLKQSWSNMYTKLKEHENLHAKQAFRVCTILRRSNSGSARLLSYTNRLKKRDLRLDSTTQHGKLKGVVLN